MSSPKRAPIRDCQYQQQAAGYYVLYVGADGMMKRPLLRPSASIFLISLLLLQSACSIVRTARPATCGTSAPSRSGRRLAAVHSHLQEQSSASPTGTGGGGGRRAVAQQSAAAVDYDSSLYLVIGDWGGQDLPPHDTPAAHAIAQTIGALFGAEGQSPPAAVLSLGDNFYDSGVTSVHDPRWQTTFEDVFSLAAMRGAWRSPWRSVLGNHDHEGNASAQIAYSSLSSRWNMPSLYYDWSASVGTTGAQTAHFVLLDVRLLVGECDAVDDRTAEERTRGEEQWAWLTGALARAAAADYLIVAAHYPLWSVCRNACEPLRARLAPLLEEHHVTLYLSGHDHCSQHIQPPPSRPSGGSAANDVGSSSSSSDATADAAAATAYHGVGAGFGCDSAWEGRQPGPPLPAGATHWVWQCPRSPYYRVPTEDEYVNGAVGAFAALRFEEEGVVVSHIDWTGRTIYTAPMLPPRSR